MMDMGDMSALGEEIEGGHEFCEFYKRDHAEDNVSAKRFTNFQDYVENHQYEEFEYILRTDGQWYVSEYGGDYHLLDYVLLSVASEQQSQIAA